MKYIQRYPFLIHSLFWILVVFFYTLFFGHQAQNYLQTLLFACFLMPTTIGTSYFLMYFLIPHFLFKRKYKQFFLFFFYSLVMSVWLELLTIVWAFIWLAEYQTSNMNPATLDISFLVAGTYMVVFGAVSIHLFKRWSEIQQAKLKTELKLKEAELNLLKAQIHPHFLFNTLNTLYGFALEKSDLTPQLVLKLSDLLDYALYHSNQDWVQLQKEIQYIQDFIDLEKLRYEEDVNIEVKCVGSNQGLYIAPMLILPFVENSFKHGLHKELGKGFIHISLTTQGQKLLVEIENSIPDCENTAQKLDSGGVGLDNVRKRLAWLYPKTHTLQITQDKNRFKVTVYIQLHTKPKPYENQMPHHR